MTFKQIQDLIKLVDDSNVGEIKIKEKEFELTIRTKDFSGAVRKEIVSSPVAVTAPSVAEATPVKQEENTPAQEEAAKESSASENTIIFKSPMIGTFYRRPSPDKDLFVNVGDKIKKGDVLCIIEAMKLFNEIEFEGAEEGTIVKILIDDSSPVEYDQALFEIEIS